mmetsp:Transcript_45662/g.67382  ORF Transcript_45662/g.67382 Transcript_45662/m.67382 type:complete len:225 (-) Transcript_45662:90-764(-)
MPKVNRVGKARAAAAASVSPSPLLQNTSKTTADDAKTNNKNVKSSSSASLSRGQKKRLAKREQYLKRNEMIMSCLKLQKRIDQKGKIDGLDALKEALPRTTSPNDETAATKPNSNNNHSTKKEEGSINNKHKKKLVGREVTHMNMVLQHPSFRKDPFATMQEHLRNTLANQKKEQEVLFEKKRLKRCQTLEEEKKLKQLNSIGSEDRFRKRGTKQFKGTKKRFR